MKTKQLRKLFNLINTTIFGGELKQPKIVMSEKKGSDLEGLCAVYNNGNVTISLFRENIVNKEHAKSVLMHEIVHYYIYSIMGLNHLNKDTTLFEEHDEEIFTLFGEAAYEAGLIYHSDLLM